MPTKTEDIEAKYGVVINFPNLELHSAAASGNVGLVHYALTHGQPVNSVLHGVLPLHAACSGGSVEVVRMLIERGANVNAPRLPRRYSDGRKSNAPSVGTAGSTPLHFAAANGHAPIVQILLACGATPDKPDKNGMTPEALAEIQGHTEVIRVMRAWESMHPSDSNQDDTNSEAADLGSPSVGESAMSEDGWYEGQYVQPSRKGKERAFSFSSAKSELNVPAIKVKNSIEGFFRRASRSGSTSNAEVNSPTRLRISTYSDGSTEVSNPESPAYHATFLDSAPNSPHIETVDGGSGAGDGEVEAEMDHDESNPLSRVTSGGSTILAPVYMPFRASSPSSNLSVGSSTVLASARQPRTEPQVQDTIDETESNASQPSEYEAALESLDAEEDERLQQEEETQSGQEEVGETISEIPAHHRHAAPSRHGFSSRRPSLPAILEKAAHPGQTFRNAMRRDRHASESTPNIPEESSQPKSGSFLRGRKPTNEPSPPASAGRRFGSIKGFFRRTNSPPSRSPSPPKQNALLPDELEERLNRASLDMSQSEGSSADARDEVYVPPTSHSAPPTKTRFFEDLSDNSDLRMAALASLAPKTAPIPPLPPVRKVSGGVLVPSPLAKEWREQDLVPPAENRFRRSRTEVHRGATPSPRHSQPGTPVYTKRRSATLPSQPRGLDWDEEVNLRRAAASEVIRRNSEKLRQAVVDAEAATDDGRSEITQSDIGDGQSQIQAEEEEASRPLGAAEVEEKAEGKGEGDSDADITPEATPAMEKPEPTMEYSTEPNRDRGASIGSFTTTSTSLSTPSQSTNPHMSVVSGEANSEMYPSTSRSPKFPIDKLPLRQIFTESDTAPGRTRGNTVSSSHSSGTSGMNFSTSTAPPASTPNTSLTPISAIGTSFPPVPEHEHELSPTPGPQKALTREEAKNLVKQNELDILQLAQLPPSLDSSRSLAAQLAAYGENHQLEQQIAAEEQRAKRRSARSRSRDSGAEADADVDGDDSASHASAGSESGGSSSGRTTGSSALRMTTIKHDKDGMYRAEAPKTQIPSINTIYDKRAAAYREKLQALTSLPPTVPSSLRQQQQQGRDHRPRAYSSISTRQSSHHHHSSLPPHRSHSSSSSFTTSMRHASSPLPQSLAQSVLRPKQPSYPSSFRSTQTQQDASRYTLHPQSHTPSQSPIASSFMTAQSQPPRQQIRKSSAPAPIAEIINTRFSGMPAPPPAPPMSASPYVSIFSSRYSGHPHDGGDSDDSDSEPQRYTVIENDWRGGHIVDNKIDAEGLKRNKWGQFKGAIGHLGRKTS